MPELPEVELLRRGLDERLSGSTIVGVEVRLAKMLRADPGLATDDLVGAAILAVSRRAKQLVVDLSGGRTLVVHLRLSGQLVLRAGGETLVAGGHPVPRFDAPLPHKSTHLILDLTSAGTGVSAPLRLYFTDIRQFGYWHLMRSGSVAGYIAAQALGPDSLDADLTGERFAAIVARRPRARLKPLLLDQTTVAGLGNIYADEALFVAGLHPLRAAGSLDAAEAGRLFEGIRATLEHALANGVARVLNGKADPDSAFPRAHGREGQPCPRCGDSILRIKVGGRSTYYCQRCQAGELGK